ncbi:MAG: RES family NAD+ phosphorylase [Candidatus Nanopelagicales bacterium]
MVEYAPAIARATGGFWRVGRGDDPLRPSYLDIEDASVRHAGNRFDCQEIGVLYFATRLEGCFAETLARFRPSASVQAAISDEWKSRGFMAVGSVPADWRNRRLAVKAAPLHDYRFLDIESVQTHQLLTSELASELNELGVDHLDIPAVRGRDRRLTRLVSAWAYHATNEVGDGLFAGIRYVSRLGDWECWAVFEDVPLVQQAVRPIDRGCPELVLIAREFNLVVF